MKLLITGGGGYIGSHMVRLAQSQNHECIVLDNFSTGHRWAIEDCEILDIDLLDEIALSNSLKGKFFDGVIHFAAKSIVGESIQKPYYYYRNNLIGTLNLVDQMLKNEINNLVFSSSAAIFGNPESNLINENHPKKPINPYGKSKLMVEQVLDDISKSNDINVTCLRYFNAAGAYKSGEIGEAHNPETHLIPNILSSLNNKNIIFSIFGKNYPTKDGTCVRDYIHVNDIAHAHLLALEKMEEKKGFNFFNLGSEKGYSVLEIIKSCEEVTGKKINYRFEAGRNGDPAILIADNTKAISELGWKIKYKSINEIIETAWLWHKK